MKKVCILYVLIIYVYHNVRFKKRKQSKIYATYTHFLADPARNMRPPESFSWLQDVEVCSELPYSGYLPSASAFCRLEEHMVPFLYTIPTFF